MNTGTSTSNTDNGKMASISLDSISNKLNILLSVIKENNGLQSEMLRHVKG